jgi:hypothetical protein
MIEKVINDPAVDPAKFHALLDFQERLEGRHAQQLFNEAFARLSKKLPRVKKDGTVEYNGKKTFSFATWEKVDLVIRPLLEDEGFTLSFDSIPKDGGGAVVSGTLLHAAGHSRTASIPLPLDTSGGKNNLQGMGSTLSYGKRYTTFMLLNIVTEGDDDDGKRGGMTFISLPQVKQINDLLVDTGTSAQSFLEFCQTAEIENLTTEQFPMAINMLMAKKKAKAARA